MTQADRSQEPWTWGSCLTLLSPPRFSDVLGQRAGEVGVESEGTPELSDVPYDLRMILRGRSHSETAAICHPPSLWPPEQHVLEELERQAVLVYTPSRKVNGKRVVCYDDRYIVKVAYERDGVIVSNDNYRDLQSENPEWKWFIEQRLLMFSFVNDRYVVAEGAWHGFG